MASMFGEASSLLGDTLLPTPTEPTLVPSQPPPKEDTFVLGGLLGGGETEETEEPTDNVFGGTYGLLEEV